MNCSLVYIKGLLHSKLSFWEVNCKFYLLKLPFWDINCKFYLLKLCLTARIYLTHNDNFQFSYPHFIMHIFLTECSVVHQIHNIKLNISQ